MNINETDPHFSKEYLADSLSIWNHASISLIDIRHHIINPEESLNHYVMPSSGFIFAITNKAQLLLGDVCYLVKRFGLYHGGKGTMLSIYPMEDWVEYYLLLYKPEKNSHNKELSRLLKYRNPFAVQYGFAPHNPLFFIERFQQMYERWKAPTSLNLFYGKTIFYQLLYEIYEELEQGEICILESDIIGMACRYFKNHYSETIVISNMCDTLGISYSHFHRLFKKQIGKSPQEYLIAIRLSSAMKWLSDSNASLREISEHCGFPDQYNFHRLFVKNIGMTPITYREKSSIDMRDYIIDNIVSFPYNEKDDVRSNKLNVNGGNLMYKEMKNKAFVAAALSLMLLLSACNTAPSNKLSTDSAQSVTTQSLETNVSGQKSNETRTVSTMMGDVEVSVNPQRIGVWVYEQELYSLGVTPISASNGNYQNVWPDIPTFSYAPDKEELMSLEPDLLITYDDENFYNEYKDIAPVIAIPLTSSAEETLRFIGDLLNLSDKAEQFIQEFNSKAQASKNQVEAAGILGKTVALIEPTKDQIWIYDNAYGRGGSILYDYLEFKLTDTVKNELGDNHFMNISYEVLAQYCNADYIVVVTGEGYDSLKENAVWQSLSAVQSDQVIEFDPAALSGRGLDEKTLSYFTDCFVGKTAEE